MIEIFDSQDGMVRLNLNCLMIPELKAVHDTYENCIPAFCFLYNITNPKSPYSNVPETDKETILLQDFPGDYSPEDPEIIEARKKLEFLYLTPTRRFFLNAKRGLETLGEYLAVASITDGKDGNFASFNTSLSRVGNIMEQFKKLEKLHDEETQSAIRGGHEASYDEH